MLPAGLPRIAVEMGVTDGWWKYGCAAVVGIDTYGDRPCARAVQALRLHAKRTWPPPCAPARHAEARQEGPEAARLARCQRCASGRFLSTFQQRGNYDDKIGINGFGRIGNVLRSAIQNFSDIEVVGINDLLEPDYLAYMLQVRLGAWPLRRRPWPWKATPHRQRQEDPPDARARPANLKWNEVGADVVIESTGLFLDKAPAQKHIDAGAKKVIMSALPKDDTPMFVFGVNHKTYAGQAIISNASCTTNCLAPWPRC